MKQKQIKPLKQEKPKKKPDIVVDVNTHDHYERVMLATASHFTLYNPGNRATQDVTREMLVDLEGRSSGEDGFTIPAPLLLYAVIDVGGRTVLVAVIYPRDHRVNHIKRGSRAWVCGQDWQDFKLVTGDEAP